MAGQIPWISKTPQSSGKKSSWAKQGLLPIGLLVAAAWAWIAPQYGQFIAQWHMTPWLVALIFARYGFITSIDLPSSTSQSKASRPALKTCLRLIAASVLAATINLVGAPWVLMAIGSTFPNMVAKLPVGAFLGLGIIACVPTTLSSGTVIASNAGADTRWTIILTMLLNMLGVISIPWALTFWQTHSPGGSTEFIAPKAIPLMLQLAAEIILPFVLGHLAQKAYRKKSPASLASKTLLARLIALPIPSLCVITISWMGMCHAQKYLAHDAAVAPTQQAASNPFGSWLYVLGFAAALHLILAALQWLTAIALRLPHSMRIGSILVGSQKTLPIALQIAAGLSFAAGPKAGHAIVACILFHGLQLLLDAPWAAWMAHKHQIRL